MPGVRLFATSIVCFLALLLPASAQGICGYTDDVLATITGARYGEKGLVELMGGGVRFQLFGNMGTGTWSLVVFKPNSTACIIIAGTSIEPMGTLPSPGGDRKKAGKS